MNPTYMTWRHGCKALSDSPAPESTGRLFLLELRQRPRQSPISLDENLRFMIQDEPWCILVATTMHTLTPFSQEDIEIYICQTQIKALPHIRKLGPQYWYLSRPLHRTPKDHINMRILQTMISGIPRLLCLGTRMWDPGVCGLLGPQYSTGMPHWYCCRAELRRPLPRR